MCAKAVHQGIVSVPLREFVMNVPADARDLINLTHPNGELLVCLRVCGCNFTSCGLDSHSLPYTLRQ